MILLAEAPGADTMHSPGSLFPQDPSQEALASYTSMEQLGAYSPRTGTL